MFTFSKCKCVGDDRPKKLTGMGCKSGGMPWCPPTSKRQTDSVCRDGTPMYMNEVLKYRTEFRTDCICKDGFSPRCRETNSWKKCPDGTDYDPSFDPWGGYAQRCNNDYEGPKVRRMVSVASLYSNPEPEAGDLLDWWKHSDREYRGKVDLVF